MSYYQCKKFTDFQEDVEEVFHFLCKPVSLSYFWAGPLTVGRVGMPRTGSPGKRRSISDQLFDVLHNEPIEMMLSRDHLVGRSASKTHQIDHWLSLTLITFVLRSISCQNEPRPANIYDFLLRLIFYHLWLQPGVFLS